MKQRLPSEALEFFRKAGAKGGKKARRKQTPEQRSAQARKAAQVRWAKNGKT